MTKPLLSIITVCYNEIERIKLTCESIVNQTMQDFEWIVLDGGSTDGTLDVLSKYRHCMSYFKTGPDGGIYAAMNQGIEIAQGEYCLFLNGGDSLYQNDTIEKVSPYLIDSHGLLIGQVHIIISEKKAVIFGKPSWPRWYFLIWCPPHQSTLCKTDILKSFGGFDTSYKILADFNFVLSAIHNSVQIKSIPVIVSNFYYDGLSQTAKTLRIQEDRHIKKKYFSYFERMIGWLIIRYVVPIRRFLLKQV